MEKIRQLKLYREDIESVLNQKCDWMKLAQKTILITGATGLLGTPLVDMLILLNLRFSLGLKLILISRHERKTDYDFVKYIVHDISKPFMCNEKIDYIIHAASNTHPLAYSSFPIDTISVNVFGIWNLLNLAVENTGCRVLLVSSCEIYGDDNLNLEYGFSEIDAGYLDCNDARSCYNESKRLSETMCAAFLAEKKQDYVTARISRSFGPTLKCNDSKAVSQFLWNALRGENIVMKSIGLQKFSYVYSADAAAALIVILLNGDSGNAYNVASGNMMLRELAETIAVSAGTKVVFEIPPEVERKGYSRAVLSILNSKKLYGLGWKAQFGVVEGIERTLKMLEESKI